MAREAISAPPAKPPRYGLWAAAQVVTDDARWQDGFRFQPEQCGSSGRVAVSCFGNAVAMEPDMAPDIVEADPFVVWAGDTCSAFGWLARDWEGRARRQLEATRSFEVAAELWTGSAVTTNPALTDVTSDTLTSGAASAVAALACLESALGTCGRGRTGMVHGTTQLHTHLVTNGTLKLDGTTWRTPNGHVWVADAGYDGSGPGGVAAGATQWAYATSLVAIRASAVEVVPGSLAEARNLSAAMDRNVNDITVVAQQMVALQWDECCHFAAEISLPVCAVAGVS